MMTSWAVFFIGENSAMKTIILHGILARKLGKSFKLAVDSTKEAMRALCVQLAGFLAALSCQHHQSHRTSSDQVGQSAIAPHNQSRCEYCYPCKLKKPVIQPASYPNNGYYLVVFDTIKIKGLHLANPWFYLSLIGGPTQTRTVDQGIMSPLL